MTVQPCPWSPGVVAIVETYDDEHGITHRTYRAYYGTEEKGGFRTHEDAERWIEQQQNTPPLFDVLDDAVETWGLRYVLRTLAGTRGFRALRASHIGDKLAAQTLNNEAKWISKLLEQIA